MVGGMGMKIPHLRIVVTICAFVLIGFGAVSAWVLGWSDDLVTKGNIIASWQNFAMLAVGFWIGSSSGGKIKDVAGVDPPAEPVEEPTP